jgi:2-oxoisovalerate dehydrogenase E1 component
VSSALSIHHRSAIPFALDSRGKPAIPLDPREIYTFGLLIREAEQTLLKMFSEGLLSGTTHTCIGQELCQMAVVRALDDPDDIILSNHRNHGHFLTYTGDFRGLLAEVMGREAGACGGIGGSQHLAYGGFHSNGVQGGMTAIGIGHGLALKMRGSRGIVTTLIGDGTLGQGLVYESLNLASVWRLPVLFVVENNGIAQTTPTELTTSGDLEARGKAFGFETWRFEDAGPDFLERVEEVVAAVRASRRPGFLVVDTERMGPHSKGDDLRDPAEIEAIQRRDPLRRMGERLPAEERGQIERAAREFVDAARASAEASPPASRSICGASIFTAKSELESRPAVPIPAAGNVRQSLNSALRAMLQSRGDVIVLGEDLHDPYGGAFKVTAGLSTEFPERVISTPISEAAIVGAGVGLALAGYRPVVEIMFADFVTLAMDQIANHAVKFPGMFPDAQVPLVIRTPSGGRRGYGPTHSQSPEGLLCGVPGLTVVFPSARHEPGTLLANAALRWGYPTVFLEHKLLYSEAVDPAGYRAAEASREDPGAELFPTLVKGSAEPDVTIVAYGSMVTMADAIAAQLAGEELDVEVVAPSLLAPLPKKTLLRLLAGRDRVVTVEECPEASGFGAELGSLLLESGFRGRFARVASPPAPIPAARSLEKDALVDEQRIQNAILKVLDLL